MATGGYDRAVDSRTTCSICLEPYKGRHPKLLPCFHTFCSPCLTQLADRQTQQSHTTADGNQDDRSQGSSDITITCPTCRTSIPLPPGGVANFQTNFYLDDAGDQNVHRPFLCDLCEEGQEAKYNCTKCLSYFCPRCTRNHNRLCQASGVTEIQSKVSPAAGGAAAKPEDADQVKMLEDVLKKLTEEEKRLGQERRAVEHDIQVRYATLLRHAGEAREASFNSLREVTQSLSDAMQTDITLARDILSRMKQSTVERGDLRQSSASAIEVLTDVNRCHFQKLLQKEGEIMLKYSLKDNNTDLLLPSLFDFMGTVIAVGGDSPEIQNTDRAGPDGLPPGKQPITSEKSDLPQDVTVKDLAAKMETLSGTVEMLTTKLADSEKQILMLQTQNTVLCRDLAAVHDKNAKLCTDMSAFQNKTTSTEGKVRDDITSLRRDQVSVRDKHSLLSQENQQLRGDLKTLQTDHSKLTADVGTLKQNSEELTKDHAALKTTVESDTRKLQTDHSKLTADVSTLKQNSGQLTKDFTALKTAVESDTRKLQTDNSKLTADVGTLKQNTAQLTKDFTALKTAVESDTRKLQTDHSKLTADVGTLKQNSGQLTKTVTEMQGDQGKLRQDVTSLEDSLKKKTVAISDLETKITKFNGQAAFHAIRNFGSVLTKKVNETVICDNVITNIGLCYNDQTGIFTAPMSGIYCFFVTARPPDDDAAAKGALYIILEGKEIGFIRAFNKGPCTGHTAVRVQAGQKVWLRSGYGKNQFAGGYATSFSGMLLQPEL